MDSCSSYTEHDRGACATVGRGEERVQTGAKQSRVSPWPPNHTGSCALFLLLLFWSGLSPAQGTLTVLNTGGGATLVSQVQTVAVSSNPVQPRLEFNFGFATQEAVTQGRFLDSFSVTIQTLNQLTTALYLTTDASGIVLAPASPGAVVIDPASVTLLAIAYPSLQPVLPNQRAYQVSAPIPVEFRGGSVNVFFDLFDNLDAGASQGWFSDLHVAIVPEPGITGLLMLAAVLCLSVYRFKR